jgi:hypothetical protein
VLLVNAIKRESDFLAYKLTEKCNAIVLGNPDLHEMYLRHRK